LNDLKQKTTDRGHEFPPLRLLPYRATQLSVKFYRWLSLQIYDPSPWRPALGRLQIIYAKYESGLLDTDVLVVEDIQ
jgi:hypothetical protein